MRAIIKHLLPLSVRDRLRPLHRRMCQGIRESFLWPKPRCWRAKRLQLQNTDSVEEYYRFAASEFGIIQDKQEITSFLEFVGRQRPQVVGEIGMKSGGTSFMLIRALPSVETIIAVDLQVSNAGKLRYFARPKQNIVCISGNSRSPQTMGKLKTVLNGRKFDLLFIDGDHSYEGVRGDFLSYASMVRDGGYIAFHDIVPDHLTRYGTDTPDQCYAGDVPLFWNELKTCYAHFEFVSNPDQNGFGIGVVVSDPSKSCLNGVTSEQPTAPSCPS